MECKDFEPSIIQDKNEYINIKEIAQAKGLKSVRSIRIEINKPKNIFQERLKLTAALLMKSCFQA